MITKNNVILLGVIAVVILSSLPILDEWGNMQGCDKRIVITRGIIERGYKSHKIGIEGPSWGKRIITVSGCVEDSGISNKVVKLTESILNSGGFKVLYNFDCK